MVVIDTQIGSGETTAHLVALVMAVMVVTMVMVVKVVAMVVGMMVVMGQHIVQGGDGSLPQRLVVKGEGSGGLTAELLGFLSFCVAAGAFWWERVVHPCCAAFLCGAAGAETGLESGVVVIVLVVIRHRRQRVDEVELVDAIIVVIVAATLS